jgi:mannose-6-phosphate isomerase-like protein (cupin superfamily)
MSFDSRILLRSEASSDAVSVIEVSVPPHWSGPPLHHHDFDEGFYVVEGRLTVQLNSELTTAGPGELLFAPRGAHHTLANLDDHPARYVLICTPGGFERRFDPAWSGPIASGKPWLAVRTVGPPIPMTGSGRS